LAAVILTLLATPLLSADIKTLRKKAEAGDVKTQRMVREWEKSHPGKRCRLRFPP